MEIYENIQRWPYMGYLNTHRLICGKMHIQVSIYGNRHTDAKYGIYMHRYAYIGTCTQRNIHLLTYI